MSLTFPVAWDSQKDVPNILCVAKCSCSLCGDKGIRAPSPHTPLLRLDPASWAELGRAVLILMALLTGMWRFGHAGVQGHTYARIWRCRDTGFQGCGSEGCSHPSPDTSYPIAEVVVTPKLAPTSCCRPCLPLGSVWAAAGTGTAEGYSWCG